MPGQVVRAARRARDLARPAAGGQAGNRTGLEYTYLVPLVIAGLLSLAALRTYPRDVATASAPARAIEETAPGKEPGGYQDGGDVLTLPKNRCRSAMPT